MIGAYQYGVKFWYKDPDTKFWKQTNEVVHLDNKWSHRHAEQIMKRKWKRDFNQEIKVVTVTCD